MKYPLSAEWLETTGTGAFSMGTVSRLRTRRYHALLMHAGSPSTGRRVLVSGFDAWLELGDERIPLTQQCYAGGALPLESSVRLLDFAYRPWPHWAFELRPGVEWREELFVSDETGETVLRWQGRGLPAGARLHVRLFLACRDYHALQCKDPAFNLEPIQRASAVVWHPYPRHPGIAVFSNAEYGQEPYWYERFEYEEERRRGFDFTEDLASPGVFSWLVGDGHPQPFLVLRALPGEVTETAWVGEPPEVYVSRLADTEAKRRSAMSPLEFSASQYVVRRLGGKSIIAGYPWFTDWGRDTFIAMRGLCLSLGRLEEAREILGTWAETIRDGLLPDRFSDDAAGPEYGAADTSLWFIIAALEYARAAKLQGRRDAKFHSRLREVADYTVRRYLQGTPFGIRVTTDGLLAVGEQAHAPTWMDAKVGGQSVTARIGKPVELQCLWVNALEAVRRRSSEFNSVLKEARASFLLRFWKPERGYLADVVDVGHAEGIEDQSLRPNQIFAIGGLPHALVSKRIGRSILEAVERELWTPLGLRTLAPGDPAYRGRYAGGPSERDAAYHQGTAWPWLMGAFGEAWLRVHDDTPENRDWVRKRCLEPLEVHLETAGLGHVSEIADGDAPHTPNGCPFQAWSLGEFLRLKKLCAPCVSGNL